MKHTKLSNWVGQVSPEIVMEDWKPICPICSTPLTIQSKSYFVFVQRHWCYALCKPCTKKYLLDVPALLYNLWFPQILDIETGQIYGADRWWKTDMLNIYYTFFENFPDRVIQKNTPEHRWSHHLKKIYQSPIGQKLKSYIGKSSKEQSLPVQPPSLKIFCRNGNPSNAIVLFNCLDEFYGHATRFIQFAYIIYDEICEELRQQKIATVMLIPEYLQFYVPDFIDEVWTATHLPAPFGRNTFRDMHFNTQVNEAIKERTVFIPNSSVNQSFGTDAKRYFHLDIVRQRAESSLKMLIEQLSFVFVFYNREDDRAWGGEPKTELRHYCALADLISATFPDSGIFLVGMNNHSPIKHPLIHDWRSNGVSSDYQARQINYLYLLSHTDCAVGVHGSHMTEISALARSVITLEAKFKYGNYTNDMFLIQSSDVIAEMSRFFPLFGNDHLTDIDVGRVFEVLQSALHSIRWIHPYLKGMIE